VAVGNALEWTAEDIDAVELQGFRGNARRRRKEPHQRQAGHRFAGTGFADDA